MVSTEDGLWAYTTLMSGLCSTMLLCTCVYMQRLPFYESVYTFNGGQGRIHDFGKAGVWVTALNTTETWCIHNVFSLFISYFSWLFTVQSTATGLG